MKRRNTVEVKIKWQKKTQKIKKICQMRYEHYSVKEIIKVLEIIRSPQYDAYKKQKDLTIELIKNQNFRQNKNLKKKCPVYEKKVL